MSLLCTCNLVEDAEGVETKIAPFASNSNVILYCTTTLFDLRLRDFGVLKQPVKLVYLKSRTVDIGLD